jgi:hypothetical protein
MREGLIPGFALLVLLAPAPAGASPECTCRAAGRSFEVGQSTCLRGERMAICVMEQNVTSWRMTDASCTPASWRQPSRLRIAKATSAPRGF